MSQHKAKNSNEFIDLTELVAHYARRWKWFLIAFCCIMALAFIYLKTKEKVYLMEANILIKPEENSPQSKLAGGAMMKTLGLSGLASSENVDDEVGILASQSLFRKMIIDLGLNTYYELKKIPFDKSLYKTNPLALKASPSVIDTLQTPLKFRVKVDKNNHLKVRVKAKRKRLGSFKFDKFPAHIDTRYGNFTLVENKDTTVIDKKPYTLDITLLGADLAAEGYRKNIHINALSKRSNMINLQVEDAMVNRGKDMLNTLISFYNKEALNDKNRIAENSRAFIDTQLQLISNDLTNIEMQIEQFKKTNKLTSLSDEAKLFVEKASDSKEKIFEIETQMSLLELMRDYMSKPENKFTLIPSRLNDSKSVQSGIEAYNELVLERNKLLQTTNENNPLIASLNEQLEMMNTNIQTSIAKSIEDLKAMRKEWRNLGGNMASRIKKVPTQEREYLDLRRRQEFMSEIYIFLLERLQEAQLSLASTTPKAKIVDYAYNYNKPVSPKKKVVIPIALALSLVLPILIIYLKDLFHNKISDIHELEKATSLPVLGEICTHHSDEKIVITPTSNNSISELFRLLRSNLQFILPGNDQKVILVTSTESNEGKSFVAANLALSLSHIHGQNVVIVGLDIRNPSLPEFFDVNNHDKGITTYLSSDAYSEDEIIFTPENIDSTLSIVPSGPIPPNPTELLLSNRLENLFDYLKQHFDYVIVDSAPVGMVSDTFSLTRVTDACVYVFRANSSPKAHLKYAEQMVQEGKLKKVYLTLNDTKTKKGYGYGYGAHATDKSN